MVSPERWHRKSFWPLTSKVNRRRPSRKREEPAQSWHVQGAPAREGRQTSLQPRQDERLLPPGVDDDDYAVLDLAIKSADFERELIISRARVNVEPTARKVIKRDSVCPHQPHRHTIQAQLIDKLCSLVCWKCGVQCFLLSTLSLILRVQFQVIFDALCQSFDDATEKEDRATQIAQKLD